MYLGIMPEMLPYPLALIYVSGFFEMLGGCGILVPRCRTWAGYGLIVLLIAVFPANVKMFTDNFQRDYQKLLDKKISIVREPKTEIYGTVAVFADLYGNLWDLIEPVKKEP